jgi:universal stress protein A
MKPTAGSNLSAGDGPPFRHILVPTDLTERTEKALQLASKFAGPQAGRITLLHVIETIEGLEFKELKALCAGLERKARRRMSAMARRNKRSEPACAVEYGRRAEEIVRFATANDVDLIVLASHRVNLSAVGRDWGTISYKVGLLAQCPVLLVK